MSSGQAKLQYYGSDDYVRSAQTVGPSGSNATTVVIKQSTLRLKKFAIEGHCDSLYHYLFLREGELYLMLKLCAISPCINITILFECTKPTVCVY